jgi:hypothetical protein
MSTAYANTMADGKLLVGSAAKYEDMAARFGFYLLVLIALISPWGSVFRGDVDLVGLVNRGVTTMLALGVIIISLVTFKFAAAIGSRPRVLAYAAFLALGMLAGVVQNKSLTETLSGGINVGGYWLLMVAVMSLHLSKEKGNTFAVLFSISTTGMALVSLIDYFHIVNVPGFNEAVSNTFLVDRTKSFTEVGRSLSGPFHSRSILGPYLALAWPVPLIQLVQGKLKNPLKVAFWSSALVILTLALVLSYTRALYLTVIAVGLYAFYVSDRRKVFRILLIVVPLFAAFFVVVAHRLPHEINVLMVRITSLGSSDAAASGAFWRLGGFMTTVNDLLQNPQGMGFTKIEIAGAHLNVHSIFTDHLRPAGLVGLVLVAVFIWPMLRLIVRRHKPAETTLLCAALLGVLAYGLSHSTHNMLMGWVVIGLLYHLSTQPDASGEVAPAEQSPAVAPGRTRRVWMRRR